MRLAGLVVCLLWPAVTAFTLPVRSLAARPTTRTVARPQVQMGLFGLGVPEIAVIVGIGGFILGPEKLASMAKDFGRIAGELKEVPKEFAEGVKESESAKATSDDEAAEDAPAAEKVET
mmetsp:Transcript_5089/g.13048  ORF Transcript_5089/g.13048 Transcript_5089/m.13048 type:complete len:119 (+) Transcript_5089:44-400(+)